MLIAMRLRERGTGAHLLCEGGAAAVVELVVDVVDVDGALALCYAKNVTSSNSNKARV